LLPITVTNKLEAARCPIRSVLSRATGKWQMLILLALQDGSLRFGQIRSTLGDITQRVLTENLRSLERDGYLTRTVDPGPPVAVHYELTELGQSYVSALEPLALWAAGHCDIVNTARADYDRANEG
jgi:DNA-binding HxlR family transcriptional regulator